MLTKEGKKKANFLYEALNVTKIEFSKTKNLMGFDKFYSTYLKHDIKIDYLEILDLETFSKPTDKTQTYIIIIAAYVENIRLIDNIEFRLENI